MTGKSSCSLRATTLGKTIGALIIENEYLSLTVLPDKGADIYRLIYKPKDIDVLAKTPAGLKDPRYGLTTSRDPERIWLEYYEGGWQLLFPNGGDPCVYKNSELSFHGEASLASWDYEIAKSGPDSVQVALYTRLYRTPYTIERIITLHKGERKFSLRERINNYGKEPCDYMWGHHPAFGPPFLGPACIIQTDACTVIADDAYAGINNPLEPNSSIPGQGLAAVIDKTGLQGRLEPGEVREAHITCSMFETDRGVQDVDNSGNVVLL